MLGVFQGNKSEDSFMLWFNKFYVENKLYEKYEPILLSRTVMKKRLRFFFCHQKMCFLFIHLGSHKKQDFIE